MTGKLAQPVSTSKRAMAPPGTTSPEVVISRGESLAQTAAMIAVEARRVTTEWTRDGNLA
jgi:hypothetical protein